MEDEREKDKDLMFCAADIIRRAKEVMGFKTDSQLAEFLGISRPTLSNWGARNSVDFGLLLSHLPETDFNWLLTGKGSPEKRHEWCNCTLPQGEVVEGEVELIHRPKSRERMDDRLVPLVDIDAAANLRTVLDRSSRQAVVGEIRIPNMPQCDVALRVSGRSMEPILMPGDIVAVREVRDFESLIYGEMYLVSFSRDDDDYLVLKYVKRSEREGYIRLVSYNPDHDPMDIPIGSITGMGMVKVSIRRHTMG